MNTEKQIDSFRDFFERNTSLFTVLGIFNALAIYSSQLNNKECSDLLSFLFSILSIATLVPIIVDTPKNVTYVKDVTVFKIRFAFLKFALILTQFLIALNILQNFPVLVSLLIFFLGLSFCINLTGTYRRKIIVALNTKIRSKVLFNLSYIIVLLIIILICSIIPAIVAYYALDLFIYLFEILQVVPIKIRY